MDEKILRDKLMEIISSVTEIDRSDLEGKEDKNIFEEFELDSLLALEILAAIEIELNIKIEDKQIELLTTFNKMFEFLKGYRKSNEIAANINI